MTWRSTACDIIITQGVNDPMVAFTFLRTREPRVLFDLTGRDVYLKIVWTGGMIEKNSIDDVDVMSVQHVAGEVTWRPTIAETLAMPLGRTARYRWEWWQGEDLEGLLASGFVFVGDGSPDVTGAGS